MKTSKRIRKQGLYNGVILPAPFEVRTPTRYGGHVITSHLSADEAQSRVRWLRRFGEDGEVVQASEQPAEQAA